MYIRLILILIFLVLFSNYSYSELFDDNYFFSKKLSDFEINNTLDLNLWFVKVKNRIEYHKKNFKNTNYQEAEKELKQIEYLIKNKLKNKETIIKKLRLCELLLMPSKVVENRGIYIDAESLPNNKLAITKLIRKIYIANFNVIYPETFFRGYSLVETPYTEKFKKTDFDILKFIINEAKKYNIQVKPWIWTFRVKSPLYGNSFFNKYPYTMALKENPKFEDREPLFVSPAEPKARQIIHDIIIYIVKNYNVNGILLDYIRYDETNNEDILSKKYFKEYYYKKYNRYPPEKISNKNDFIEWQLWRENQVNIFISYLRNSIKQIKPNVDIGVSIFRTEKETRLIKMQNWKHWANNNMIDFIAPMLYADNYKDLDLWIKTETKNNKRKDFYYPTIGLHRLYKNDDVFSLYYSISSNYMLGLNLFSTYYLDDSLVYDLSKSIFRNKAIIPHNDIYKSIKTIIEYNNNRLKKINKLSKYQLKINSILEKINRNNIEVYINEFLSVVNTIDKNYSEIKNEMLDDYYYMKKIFNVFQQRERQKNFYTEPEIPEKLDEVFENDDTF
ncbi:MAG: hypothetical protein KatS3mg068_0684 [Candidatus Sericytochromatia bacterium]|nr:MAG: hypothetical protein KatS3mg068_0684 [Candidatus Sericytochromatia bacterium]